MHEDFWHIRMIHTRKTLFHPQLEMTCNFKAAYLVLHKKNIFVKLPQEFMSNYGVQYEGILRTM